MARHKPHASFALTAKQLKRFHSSYEEGRPDECWPWRRFITPKGYGSFFASRFNYRAHRIAFELATGQHPGELLVCHTCDNRACVNPAHLWLGDDTDNSVDKWRKLHGLTGVTRACQTHCARGHKYPSRALGEKVRCPTCIQMVRARQAIKWLLTQDDNTIEVGGRRYRLTDVGEAMSKKINFRRAA